MTTIPVAVQADGAPEDKALRQALATIALMVPRDELVAIADYLRRLRDKKAHGGLDVSINLRDGAVGSVDKTVRDHWQPPRKER